MVVISRVGRLSRTNRGSSAVSQYCEGCNSRGGRSLTVAVRFEWSHYLRKRYSRVMWSVSAEY